RCEPRIRREPARRTHACELVFGAHGRRRARTAKRARAIPFEELERATREMPRRNVEAHEGHAEIRERKSRRCSGIERESDRGVSVSDVELARVGEIELFRKRKWRALVANEQLVFAKRERAQVSGAGGGPSSRHEPIA